MCEPHKICTKCKIDKPLSQFYIRKTGKKAGKPRTLCKSCDSIDVRERGHRRGYHVPCSDKNSGGPFLGIYVADRALSKFFDNIQRMPNGNPGYDFICSKGFKIDAKSACLYINKFGLGTWVFRIRYNQTADYFLCLAFDNRASLEPQHVWLIPKDVASIRASLSICNWPYSLRRWSAYEMPLDRVVQCCDKIKEEVRCV